jgi:hypothetical protein
VQLAETVPRTAQQDAAAGGKVPAGKRAATEHEVALLQGDLRLLVRYLVRHRPETLPDPESPPNGGLSPALLAGRVAPGVHLALLDKSPAEIAGDPILLCALYESLAALSRRAEPATSMSILLTCAFLDLDWAEAMRPQVRRQRRNLARWIVAISALGLLIFCIAIGLLIHVDRGRRSVEQFEQVSSQYAAALAALEQATARDPSGEDAVSRCQAAAANTLPALPAGAAAPCRLLRAARRRLDVARVELRDWNQLSDRLLRPWWQPLPRSDPPDAADLSESEWGSSELRTSARLAGLSGFVLPILLGLLGACTYVYRDFDRQVRTWTLHQGAGVHGSLRILLGAILGGLLGVVWTSGQPIQVEGVTLSLGALAFFVGFAVEIVFRILDMAIAGVASRVGK